MAETYWSRPFSVFDRTDSIWNRPAKAAIAPSDQAAPTVVESGAPTPRVDCHAIAENATRNPMVTALQRLEEWSPAYHDTPRTVIQT